MRQFILSLVFLINATVLAFAFDTTSPPDGVWTDDQYQSFWTAHKLSDECLTTVKEAAPKRVLDLALTSISDDELASRQWRDIYPSSVGLTSSDILVTYIQPPKPIFHAEPPDSTKHYGDRNGSIDYALNWFSQNSTRARFEGGNGPAIQALKATLLDWAKANALSGGLGNPDMPTNIDYTVSVLLIGIENSISTVVPILNQSEKRLIAHWMNRVMRDASNAWFGYMDSGQRRMDRVANGPFRQAQIVLIWALIINDDRAIQKVIDTYKTAIHDMRPDGTFALDSNRGGMGLTYQNHATNHLIMIASLLKITKGLNVFNYSVNGRSIHNAVDWVIRSIDNMSKMNMTYARPCRWGDKYGTVTSPSRGYVSQLGYLVVYAVLNPSAKQRDNILNRLGQNSMMKADISELNGGTPVGLFGFKKIGANSESDSSDKSICTFALTGDKQSFTRVYSFKKYVQQAEQLGLTPEKCQAILANQ